MLARKAQQSAKVKKTETVEQMERITDDEHVEKIERVEKIEVEEVMSMTGLVPLQGAYQDDMKKIADMNEGFSKTMEPILRMYNAAMNVTTTRIDIIKDEFKYRGIRCPVHHIDTRLKSTKSILGKLEKKDLDLTLNAAINNIYDIAGVRVVCPYIKDVYMIRDRLMDQDDVHIMEMKDYIAQPKKNGYRSLHMIIRVPVYFMSKKQFVPVEIQIRTEAMDLWASLEHDIKYKSLYQDIGVDFTGELLECSKLIYQAEEKMEFMNNALED